MKNIGIIGIGNLGHSLAKSMCLNRLQNFVSISDTDPEKLLPFKYDLGSYNIDDIVNISDIIFLTVKPENIKDVCIKIKSNLLYSNNIKTVVSAAAGVNTDQLKRWLGDEYHVARCMPNIPISINRGSTVLYTDMILNEHKIILNEILNNPVWVEEEKLMDNATSLFGCGPAYVGVYYMIYRDIATECGFTEEQTKELLVPVFGGTADIISKGISPEDIIDQVASKGGATGAMLEVLDNEGIRNKITLSVSKSLDKIKNIKSKLD